jgi:hypothetical protein
MKAFPNMTGQQGMDLRDYFAAKAMHSFIMGAFMEERDIDYKDMAEAAYELADAMMKARNETT